MTRDFFNSFYPSRIRHLVVASATIVCVTGGALGASAQDGTDPFAQPQPDAVSAENPAAATDLSPLESELASARRMEVELQKLLLPDGQLNLALGDSPWTRLSNLSTRCGILANSAMHDETRMLLLGYQARALAALMPFQSTEQARARDPQKQLLVVAEQIRALALPGAEAAADYWSLLAELAELSRAKVSPARRQDAAEQALAAYVQVHQGNEQAREFLLDTRLSLARLMDQRGAQRDATQQINLMGKLPANSPRLNDIRQLRESISRLGKPIDFESISTQLVAWRSADHLGKPVLIHVYADSVDASVRMIDVISRSIVQGSLSGIAVVSLRVGEPIAGSILPPWPTLPVQAEPGGVLDELGVASLPTLVWLDREGRLASIGSTSAVLNQLAQLQPSKPGDEGQQAPESSSDLEPAPTPESAEQGLSKPGEGPEAEPSPG